MKQENLKQFLKRDLALEEVIALLSKQTLSASKSLLQNINDTCDSAESILAKGTKWAIFENLKKEHDFYESFYNDYKDHLDHNDLISRLYVSSVFRDLYEGELSDSQRTQLEDYLNNRTVQLAVDLSDEFRKRMSDTYHQKENYETGVVADYLTDTVITRKRISRGQDVDYDLIHSEKSQEEDLRKLSERLIQKIKQAQ